MTTHSVFSPSASNRILNCPPSLRLCEKEAEESSPYAQEGTDAHSLCAYLVEKALGRDIKDPTEDLTYYNEEMLASAEEYTAYVMEEYCKAKQTCSDPQVLVEQHVDISRWVPDCGGTADCIILADGMAEIIDFKYGLGVLVSADSTEFGGNPQLMCYCLGVLEMFDGIFDINSVKMAIFQPRRSNVSEYTMTKADLLKWADNVLAPKAALALDGKGEFKAGDHCRFCKVKANCRKRAEYNLETAKYDFAMPDLLQDYEVDAILMTADRITEWINDVKEFALAQALDGMEYEHFKLVEGRSVRKYTNEDDVAKVILKAGYDPYEKKLRGITSMTALLGKKKFDELLDGLLCKPEGKPTLVPKSDKHPAMKNTAEHDFKKGD